MTNKITTKHWKYLTYFLAASLLIWQLFCVFYLPVWRDDAFFASVAKNLVLGRGYSAVFFDKSYLFHAGISSGPVLILPAAFLIFIFGNQFWVTSLTIVLLIWALLLLIFFKTKKLISEEDRWPFYALSLFFSFLASYEGKDYFTLWRVLMGEIPSALCVILAVFFFSTKNPTKKDLIKGGLLLAAALLFKTISLLASATVLAVFVIRILLQKEKKITEKIINILIPVFCLSAPFIIFEIIKFLSLGGVEYRELQLHNAEFYRSTALVWEGYIAILMRFFILLSILSISLLLLFPVIFSLFRFLYKKKSEKDFWSPCVMGGLILLLCFLTNFLWWITLSIAAHRHLIVGLIFFFSGFFLLLSTYFRNINFKAKFLNSLFLVSLFFALVEKLSDGFGLEEKIQLQRKYVAVLPIIENLKKEGFELVSCGNNFELEYLLKDSENFKFCSALFDKNNTKPKILVSDFNFDQWGRVVQIDHSKVLGVILNLPEEVLLHCQKKYFESKNLLISHCSD